jgi:hypothetical protein
VAVKLGFPVSGVGGREVVVECGDGIAK